MIHLDRLKKDFGTRTAVDGVDLDVPEGEIFGLLGHNGAGKSTLIGMMLGQVWPTSGGVKVCGFDVTSRRQDALRRVGAIFEMPAFYDYLTAWQNLRIFSEYTERTPAARIREVIDWVGLGGREHSRVKTFSHGMRARLALAQALLPDPKLLILDEPGDGLDPEGIHEMRQTIQRLHREFGLTILFSSHQLNEVEQLCTRIAVLNRGRKVFDGTMADVVKKKNRARLVVGDFEAAAKGLLAAKLITGAHDGKFVSLADGVRTSEVVRHLAGQGMDIHEIAIEEPALEDFYLSLMKQN